MVNWKSATLEFVCSQTRGINKVTPNLKQQLISVEGTTAPSSIVQAIQSTGRDAILRGSGASDSQALPNTTFNTDGLLTHMLQAPQFVSWRHILRQ